MERVMHSTFKLALVRRSTLTLILFSLFSLSLSVARMAFSGRPLYFFMAWNLFLAFVPWAISTIMESVHIANKILNRVMMSLLLITWLAFFPNAPYVLTDLIYVGREKSAPIWFDLTMLLSYGFTGMLFGFISLASIQNRLKRRFGHVITGVIVVGLIYLSCFGVFLGRYMRWNSWDLVSNLDSVLADILKQVAHPLAHSSTWVFTLLFGTLLCLTYYGFLSFHSADQVSKSQKEKTSSS